MTTTAAHGEGKTMDEYEIQAMTEALGALVQPGAASDEVTQNLLEFGWPDMLSEAPQPAVRSLFELQGENASQSAALSWVMTSAMMPEASPEQLLGLSVIIPSHGWGAVGSGPGPEPDVDIDGLLLPGDTESGALLPLSTDGSIRIVRVGMDDLVKEPMKGIDPQAGLHRVTGTVIHRTAEAVPSVHDAGEAWAKAVTAGRLALSHQIAGTMSSMIDLAVEHARTREQFGTVIGSYQAVAHKLAEARTSLEACRAALAWGWDEGSEHAALVTKALAGRGLREVSRHCQQVLAGMGFSAEHAFPSLYRRGVVLDVLLGSSVELTEWLGTSLRSSGQLLPLPGLSRPVSEPLGTENHRTRRSWD